MVWLGFCCTHWIESYSLYLQVHTKVAFFWIRAATETGGSSSSQARPTARGEWEKPGVVRGAAPDDERVPSSIGRASNPNKSEIPERANDRTRRGKTQRVGNFSLFMEILM